MTTHDNHASAEPLNVPESDFSPNAHCSDLGETADAREDLVRQAVYFALLTRLWQFIAGPITLVLIARFFSPETQGYFYTFASLMGLQILFEMGLHTVIINMASHEWARLSWRPGQGVEGDEIARTRLASLARQATFWYGWASVGFGIVIGLGGSVFLNNGPLASPQWLPHWLLLVLLSSLQLWTMPLISVLEGCNQVTAVHRMRVVQAVFGNLVVWGVICLGGGLWAAVGSAVVKLSCELYLLLGPYHRFFRSLHFPIRVVPSTSMSLDGEQEPSIVLSPTSVGLAPASEEVSTKIDWWREVWPLQWSVAWHSVLQYLAYFLFPPLMFHFHGATCAGQMGMTWTVLTTLQYAAFSWVQTRTPLFGMLIAERKFTVLDRVFFRVAGVSLGVLGAGCMGVTVGVLWLSWQDYEWSVALCERVLSPAATAWFAASIFLIGTFQCLVSYTLAHKRNPLLVVSVSGNVLVLLVAGLAGALYGPVGAGFGLFVILAVWTLPGAIWIWARKRREWHENHAP